MKNQWLLLWSLWAARLVRQPTTPVRVQGGWLRGAISPNGAYKSYVGIPYASHPEKRFQAPGPPPSWRGVYEAVDQNIKCPQRLGQSLVIGQEDCLVLNVFTPMDATDVTSYPVMLFIHGGGFFDGSASSMYGPEYLVNKGVILVTINYRLNILGFACLRIKEAPGNAGMKDQVAALKWVQRNIKAFGGDPDNVTIFGESAGAASVSYHIVSRMSKGLFHKAIIQSGSSTATWAFQFKPVYMASLLTKVMQYLTEDPYEIYNILMNKSNAELIATRVPRKEGNVVISELLYVPCIEDELDGEEAFLKDLPYNLLSKGEYNKVPVMIGSCNEEGLLLAALENDTTIAKIAVEKTLPKNLHIPSEAERKEVAKKLHNFYLGNEAISHDTLANLSRLHGEVFITYPTLEEAELYLKTNDKPVYSYVFSYYGWRNLVKLTMGKVLKHIPGATHADDLFYIFSQNVIPSFFEYQMINRVTTMWANFAKYGNPTPVVSDLLPVKWPPLDKASPQSLVIDKDFSIVPLWNTDSLKYLRQVYSKYRRKHD
ncbi:esterase FE4-like [Maniola hyperantus]|uniref:esterase FE4-like n=1 Tax=Aphantopus hyperantus TaxID=2795564 RepID=UPI0015698915|nr:esterase FE4-like [Maniola hyperantus]